ncbi:MAG: hypothetical protein QW648_00840 [Nanoarchaeales archaeon]
MADKEVVKWSTIRTTLRGIGITLISTGSAVFLGGNLVMAGILVVAGLIVLGIKDYLEEKAYQEDLKQIEE